MEGARLYLSASHTYSSPNAGPARKEVYCAGYQPRPGVKRPELESCHFLAK